MNHRTNISFDFDNGIRFDLNQLEFKLDFDFRQNHLQMILS